MNLPITTQNVEAPRPPQPLNGFFSQAVDAINAGAAVEMHVAINTGGGKTLVHLSMISKMLRNNRGQIGIVMADDIGQGDGVAETRERGPYWFDPTNGNCITNPRLSIVGMLIEKWEGQ